MNENALQTLELISDRDLLARTLELARGSARVTALLVAHLAEIDARRLYLSEGFPSLFAYCVQNLRLSEGAAYRRIQAARAARRFPAIVDSLARGDLHLGALSILASLLTGPNHRIVIERAAGRTRREVEELAAELRAMCEGIVSLEIRPGVLLDLFDAPSRPVARNSGGPAAPADTCSEHQGEPSRVVDPRPDSPVDPESGHLPAASTPVPPHRMASGEGHAPVGRPVRYKLVFQADAVTRGHLHEARDLLRHVDPGGDMDQVLARALELLVRTLRRRKYADRVRTARSAEGRAGSGEADRNSVPRSPRGSRFIPATVRRQVWDRDAGCCAFRSTAGHRCRETGMLEFHHRIPYARGGPSTLENIELRCRAHNQYEELPSGAHRRR